MYRHCCMCEEGTCRKPLQLSLPWGADGAGGVWSPGFGCVAHQGARPAGQILSKQSLDHTVQLSSSHHSRAQLTCSPAQVCKVFTSYAEGTTLKVVMLAGQKTFAAEQASLSELRWVQPHGNYMLVYEDTWGWGVIMKNLCHWWNVLK